MRDQIIPVEREFGRYKTLAEEAMAQVDETVFQRITPGFDNSIAVLLQMQDMCGRTAGKLDPNIPTSGEICGRRG